MSDNNGQSKVIKHKILDDGTIIVNEYDKIVQINIDDKIDFFPVFDNNENFVKLPDGRLVLYDENIGFPSGKYWVNYFVLPPIGVSND